MKRKRWIWMALSLVLALSIGGYVYRSTSRPLVGLAQSSNPDPTAIPQAVARQGDLTVSVSGSGSLAPVSSADLSFVQPGTLVEINVTPGDRVQAGEALARLKIDKTPAQHQAELASAELAAITARQNLDQIEANASLEAAQALSALEASQTALEDLQHPEMEQAQAMQAVAEAEKTVTTAQLNLYILQSQPSQEAIDTARASLLFKQKDYQEIQKAVARLENQIKSAPSETARDRLEAQLVRTNINLAKQKIAVDEASARLASLGEPPDPTSLSQAQADLSTAQAALAQARRDLETALAAPSPADIAEAQAQIVQAQSSWEHLKDGPDPVTLGQAKAELAQAQAQLALVKQEQLELDLKAPFDGIILSISAVPGDHLKDTSLLTLADISQPLVEISVDETDLPNVRAGQEVAVTFDALPDTPFTGKVIQVDPSLQRIGNTYAARLLARLDPPTGGAFPALPLGLSASADIRIGNARNAILIPVEALHQDEQGNGVVYIVQGGQLEQRPVMVGLMDLTTAEITSGLQAGEVVATGAIDLSEGLPK